MKSETKFGILAIILLTLLIIRIISQGVPSSLGDAVILSLYVISVVGVFMRKKWGALFTTVIALVDIFYALVSIPTANTAYNFGVLSGAFIYDLVLLFLAYKDYRAIR